VVRTLRNGRVSDEALACVPAAGVSPEALVADREARERLAQLVAELLASDREAEAVTAVLWGTMESAQAAEAYSLPVATIYAATREAKRKLARCPRLMEVL
jgi:DNA-directed RNA polymerase specialized sigma24 family protein